MKKAIIIGCTGQIGSHLADNLLNKDYKVYGIARRVSTPNYTNIQHLLSEPNFILEEGDVTDLSSLIRLFYCIQPNEIYNQAAQSHVKVSFNQPILTANITGMGALNVFEAARQSCPKAKIYHASTSEIFGGDIYPQNEKTIFNPRSPYGVSKLFAHQMAHCYKESYGMFIVCGICFNMEGPRRGIEFVTQKIVDAVVRQVCGEQIVLELGNLEAKRDWQHAEDACEGMWLMLQQKDPKDYVLSSGEAHSVFEFVNLVYKHFGIDIIWLSDHTTRLPIGVDTEGNTMVKSVEKYYRPNEVNILLGDSSRARKELGWIPKYSFPALISDMVSNKLEEFHK